MLALREVEIDERADGDENGHRAGRQFLTDAEPAKTGVHRSEPDRDLGGYERKRSAEISPAPRELQLCHGRCRHVVAYAHQCLTEVILHVVGVSRREPESTHASVGNDLADPLSGLNIECRRAGGDTRGDTRVLRELVFSDEFRRGSLVIGEAADDART